MNDENQCQNNKMNVNLKSVQYTNDCVKNNMNGNNNKNQQIKNNVNHQWNSYPQHHNVNKNNHHQKSNNLKMNGRQCNEANYSKMTNNQQIQNKVSISNTIANNHCRKANNFKMNSNGKEKQYIDANHSEMKNHHQIQNKVSVSNTIVNSNENAQPKPVNKPISQKKANFVPPKFKPIIPQKKQNDNVSLSEMKKLSYWGLPSVLTAGYEAEGIKALYDWQVQCMNNKEVLKGGNLVYSAPTGGGKTLVAELLMLRNILRTKRKAIFVLPFVSIVVEKVRYFTKIFKSAKIMVKGFYSNKGGAGGLGRNCDIAICTIEKANSIVNRLICDNKLMDMIGIMVLDEMHMIGDGHRGYILELLLTKIRYVQEQASEQYQQCLKEQVNVLQHSIVFINMYVVLQCVFNCLFLSFIQMMERCFRRLVIPNKSMHSHRLIPKTMMQPIGYKLIYPSIYRKHSCTVLIAFIFAL